MQGLTLTSQRSGRTESSRATLPRDKSPESTLALLNAPYTFISHRCDRYKSNVFQARILLQRTICMVGPEAAELFSDTNRFTRTYAAPRALQKTLLGVGALQSKDGEIHLRRKETFLSLATPDHIKSLVAHAEDHWHGYLARWQTLDQVHLFQEIEEIMCRAVCDWAGVPLSSSNVKRRTRDFGAMIDGAGGIGMRHLRGRLARKRSERWIQQLIQDIRSDKVSTAQKTAAFRFAWHREPNDQLLSPRAAAIELINILRPTVAVARFITFAALALHEHPQWRERITKSDEDLTLFVQEVRRFYPFFPFVVARVRRDFTWQGYRFPTGTRVLLDLYGTNHDVRSWDDPMNFRPERFRTWNESAFNFIPQGAGDHRKNHRCAGEWITIELLKAASKFLAGKMRYEVPPQDLRVDIGRAPAAIKSGFVINNVTSVTS